MEPRSYGPYPYQSIRNRKRINWPNGARIAFWVVPNIEVFALDSAIPGSTGKIPDVSAFGRRDYGNRVAV